MHPEKRKVQINKGAYSLLIICIVVLLVIFLFQRKEMTINELNDYINDSGNGLLIEKNVNGVDASLTYRPADLIAYQTCRGNREKTGKGEIDSCFMVSYRDAMKFHYFLLSLSIDETEILKTPRVQSKGWQKVSYYLSFSLEREAMLITDQNDTIFPSLVHYPRLYGTSTSTDLIMVFPKPENPPADYFSVVIPDFGFSTGTIRFKYKMKDIESIPRLKI